MNPVLILLFLFYGFYPNEASWNISNEGFLLYSTTYTGPRKTDYFSIVFRTEDHNGIFLVATGQDNFLLLELYHSVIRLSVRYIGQNSQEPYVGYLGSGLSDNNAHQVEIYREANGIMLVLDRGTSAAKVSWPVIGWDEFVFKIEKIYVGGFKNPEALSRYISLSKVGFTGCIEKAVWNNVNLLYQPFANNSVSYCKLRQFQPISFLSTNSYVMLNRQQQASGLSMIFDIMVYLNYTTIFLHQDDQSTLNISIYNGSFFMTLDYGSSNYINAYLPMIKINDGKWHRISVQLPGKDSLQAPIVVFGVDDEIVASASSFSYDTDRDLKFGGFGFIGCINNLMVDGNRYNVFPSTEQFNISTNGCRFPDQCVPNPCQHAGFCTLYTNSVSCDCPLAYPGSVCEDAYYYPSCSQMFACGYKNPGNQLIDLDGTGPLDPVQAVCNNMEAASEANVITTIDPLIPGGKIVLQNEPTTVPVPYLLTPDELKLLTMSSMACYQEVTYECSASRITDGNSTMLVWLGGDGNVHEYWNTQGLYGKCECSLGKNTCDGKKKCNCDVNDRVTRTDSTILRFKDHLPIMGITAMDISSSTGKSATVQVGPLICLGIGAKANAVTFQEIFSYLPIPSINFANPGSIQFEFKTNRAQGNVMIFTQGRPANQYLVIELTDSSTVTARFTQGTSSYVLAVSVPSSISLNNLEYHSVYFKMTAQLAYMVVDGVVKQVNFAYNYQDPIQVDPDNAPFYLGGSPYNMFSGYKGIIRRLKINGELLNLLKLSGYGSLASAGVYSGVYSSCMSSKNPCNFGECREHFTYFVCDCSTTPYNGKRCENEVGAIFDTSSSSLTYRIEGSYISNKMIISISFRTTQDGLLFLLQGENENVFISMDIYDGNLRLALNLWPDRTSVPDIYKFSNSQPPFSLTDGQTNVVQFRYESYQFFLAINGMENFIYIPIRNSEQPLVYQPRWVYMGNAPKLLNFPGMVFTQFTGCLGGMKLKFTDATQNIEQVIDVMKAVGGSNTKVIGNGVTTGTCVGNLSFAPPAQLIATPANLVPGGGSMPVLSGSGNGDTVGTSWGPVVAGIVILVLLMLFLGSVLFLRWYSRNSGFYYTQEGENMNAKKVQSKKYEKRSSALPQVSTDEVEGWYL